MPLERRSAAIMRAERKSEKALRERSRLYSADAIDRRSGYHHQTQRAGQYFRRQRTSEYPTAVAVAGPAHGLRLRAASPVRHESGSVEICALARSKLRSLRPPSAHVPHATHAVRARSSRCCVDRQALQSSSGSSPSRLRCRAHATRSDEAAAPRRYRLGD